MNWFDMINEMAFSMSKLEDKVTNVSEPIVLHIIKLLAFVDDTNRSKHIKGIDNWLLKIESYEPKVKRSVLVSRYPKWIILDWLGTEHKLERTIERRLASYHNLPRSGMSVQQIHTAIKGAAIAIGKDVALEKYTTITDYIKF